MPSTSIAQQRLMGQAYALKTGELKSSDLDPKYRKQIEDLAASMSEKDLKDFAETSHKGLPQKVKENYTMNNHIPTFESFINENYKENYKRFSPEEQKLSYEISNIMWMKFRRMDAKEKINVLNTLMTHIMTTGSLQEAIDVNEDYSKLSLKEKQLSGELSQAIFKYKNLKKEEKLNVLNSLISRVESGDLSESIDVKYWADYNTDTSGQGQKEHEVKSKDFEDTFEDAVVYWNQEADGAENRIKGAQIQKIKKLAQEFFKKAGWISSNVIQAMIAQES